MHIPNILALDFDGVLCDGMREYFETSRRTYGHIWPNETVPGGDLFPIFRALRPVIMTGWEMPLLLRAIVQGCPATAILQNWEAVRAELMHSGALHGSALISTLTDTLDEVRRRTFCSVRSPRNGGAAALGSAAIQIGGALGIPIMVSALLATARPLFYEQMRQATGLTDLDIQNAVAAIRRGMQEATTEHAFTVPAALRAQIREANEVAFGIGVGRCFLVAAIACVLCAVLVWVGAHRHVQEVSDRPPQRAT